MKILDPRLSKDNDTAHLRLFMTPSHAIRAGFINRFKTMKFLALHLLNFWSDNSNNLNTDNKDMRSSTVSRSSIDDTMFWMAEDIEGLAFASDLLCRAPAQRPLYEAVPHRKDNQEDRK